MPSTTLGYERLVSWAFQTDDEREFVRAVLAGQPEPPRYFGRMKLLNRDGAPPRRNATTTRIAAAELARALDAADPPTVVDARSSAQFAAGFIPGSISIPAGPSFLTWAGSLIDPERDLCLIVSEGEAQAQELGRQLALVGIDRVVCWGGSDLLIEWRNEGRTIDCLRVVDAPSLMALPGAEVIDVRGQIEWDAGHIPGARHLFLGDLVERARSLPRERPVIVVCEGGTRSSIAASLLRAVGHTNVLNFSGGFAAWRSAGLPIEVAAESDATP
jgi:hydroxyacylglutathione hydrolase